MNLETKITIYKFTPQLFTLTQKNQGFEVKAEDDNWAFGMERYTERNRHFE